MIKPFIKKLLYNLGSASRPNFIIIGAQKAGTSALFSILKEHSHIVPSKRKEVHYFDNDDWYEKKALNKYHDYFRIPFWKKNTGLLFEATPIYIYHPKVAQRLYDYDPELKLILLLRNPTQRALSAWSMYHHHFKTGIYAHLHDPRSFREAITNEIAQIETIDYYTDKRAYVKRGIYLPQIQRYLEHFPKEQLLILESEEIKGEFDSTISKICHFLNIPKEAKALKITNKRIINNKDEYREELKMLDNFYQPHNKQLFDFLGKSYAWGN